MSLRYQQENTLHKSNGQCPKASDEFSFGEGKIFLQPVAMRVPNRHSVYSPSKLELPREISYDEFHTQYANHSTKIRVCFDEVPCPSTIFQRSELITAYGFGLDCWYILVPNGTKNISFEK